MSHDSLTKADSELALTALLATSVLAFENDLFGLYPVVQLVGLSLLATTLVRRICIIEGLGIESILMRLTDYVIRPATTVTFLYIVYLIQITLTVSIPLSNGPLEYSVLAVSFTLILAFGWQFGIGTFFSHGGSEIKQAGEDTRGSLLGVYFLRFGNSLQRLGSENSEHFVQKSLYSYQKQKRVEELVEDENYDEIWKRAKKGWSIVLNTILAIAAVILIYVLMIWVVQYLVGGAYLKHAVLLAAITLVSGYFQNWYSRYGLVRYDKTPMTVSVISRTSVYLFYSLIFFGPY